MKKWLWFLFVLSAVVIGLYPFIYFLIDPKFGLLASKSEVLLSNIMWQVGFYTHIVLGGLALLIGWIQFVASFRIKNLNKHRLIGKLYVILVGLSSLAGFYIALDATGGLVSKLGFMALAIVWLLTTFYGYSAARLQQLERHKKMMIYSYAACYAAVTLRIWLPLLMLLFGDFITAYRIVAWLCWVPNLFVAYMINKR